MWINKALISWYGLAKSGGGVFGKARRALLIFIVVTDIVVILWAQSYSELNGSLDAKIIVLEDILSEK